MKYALTIGLNSVDPFAYGGWGGQLFGCHNDANDLAEILKDRGFSTRIMLSSQATITDVLAELHDLSVMASAGDLVVISYSGHGAQIADLSNDEPDGLDETWCLYDGMLLDDELHFALSKFKKGVRVVVLSDSCHSGTVIKAALNSLANKNRTPKCAPDSVSRDYAAANKLFKKAYRARIKASIILISGCQDNQFSYDGAQNGQFTGALLEVYDDGRFKLGYRDFRKAIVKRMPPDQTPQFLTMGRKDLDFERITPVFYAP